ncbi:MAG: RidA family protein [Gammaproteobacteria bacterium]|nr:RidA family protein [Gammaproteobacteria bacterium]NNM00824.1 RidA family protein [Gammaproteobacteria bacterium]
MAKMTPVNPWTWQEKYGFHQAVSAERVQRTVYCAGQTSVDTEGNPLHPGQMEAQAHLSLDNLETVLQEAGMLLKNVIRLNYYVTDVPAYMAIVESVTTRLGDAGCEPACTLLGVAALFHPDVVIEIEATAIA